MTLYEYIWIDGFGNTRGKTRVGNYGTTLDLIPEWNYDGSSTQQASGSDSEIILKPVRLFPDPFRGEDSMLVLCETFTSAGLPSIGNTRTAANKIFTRYACHEPMYGIEQEFFISSSGIPLAFLSDENIDYQQHYYCGVGGDNAIGREMVEMALDKCLKAGLSITGMNAEVAPSQWELQVCAVGIDAADELIMLRYIVNRTLECFNLSMDIRPKPLAGDWNGSGCHVNFSTLAMRSGEPMVSTGTRSELWLDSDQNLAGIKLIRKCIEKMGVNHNQSVKYYGLDNEKRLTGLHETSSYDKFSYGVADRGASIRIPRETEKNGVGYFEDRRPGSNIDPYLVCAHILEVCMDEL